MRRTFVGEADRGHAGDKWMNSLWIMYLGSYWFLRGCDQTSPTPGGFEQELACSYRLRVLSGGMNGSKALFWHLL